MTTLLRRGWGLPFAFLASISGLACPATITIEPKGGDGGGGSGASGTQGGGGMGTAGGVTDGGGPFGGMGGFGGSGLGGNGGLGGSGGEGAGSLGGSGPVECSMLPSYPVAYETLQGFTTAEDFAFDSLGNQVSIDANGNLVRIKKTGETSLWIPSFAFNSAGIVALPDDSVVVCDVENNSIKRAFPNGATSVLLGGLDYPNGIDVGPDGFIYVAEDNGGRVLRVHPDTGASTVVVNVSHPNGIAFTEDPTVFYVGSYNEQLIYKVVQPVPGQPGTASLFAPSSQFEGGGIDGMGVDKCGNVYAAEFVTGNVYRITPEGVVSKIVDLPSSWIPNIKWGRGLGGFARHVMYVADRDQGRLFGIAVSAEGVDEFFDL